MAMFCALAASKLASITLLEVVTGTVAGTAALLEMGFVSGTTTRGAYGSGVGVGVGIASICISFVNINLFLI
jgi:hypothetical protein